MKFNPMRLMGLIYIVLASAGLGAGLYSIMPYEIWADYLLAAIGILCIVWCVVVISMILLTAWDR